MEEIKQYSIFDVLRGILNETSETYSALVEESSKEGSGIPPADNIYVPPPLRSETAADGIPISTPISIPKAPKVTGWLKRNWYWVAIGIVALIIIIYLYRRKRARDKEDAFRQWEAEHLPKINYPWPSASGPVVVSEPDPAQPEPESLLQDYFDELDKEKKAQELKEAQRAQESSQAGEIPQEHEEFKS